MKKAILFFILSMATFASFAQVQQSPNYVAIPCDGLTDFTITLDGVSGNDYHIKAKPKDGMFYDLNMFRTDYKGFSYQWTPAHYEGQEGPKQLCDDFSRYVTSQTLKSNIREFSSRNLAQDISGNPSAAWPSLKKGDLYYLSLTLRNPFCDCMNQFTLYSFRLNTANKIEVCKLQTTVMPKSNR
ncbi:MAG: hypothetical protein U0Y10_06885 [Spirosomataceae bacterium]